MDPILQEQVAAFRYSLISGIVNRKTPMLPGEIIAYFEDVSAKEYFIPNSNRTRISVRTLERYKSQYEKYGYDGLRPKDHSLKGCIGIKKEVLEEAKKLKLDRPERSIENIIFTLENSGIASVGDIAASTLARQFRKEGLSRKELTKAKKNYGFQRIEVEDVNIRWQADFQHTLYLPDPSNPERKKKAMLFAIIDDYSRYIVHAQFYWDEKMPRLEDSLKKAILRHGLPEQFYCDNGSAFSTGHLQRICARLGIRLSHSIPYRPMGRGKIERFFRHIDTSFKIEAYAEIENGSITTLENLNNRLNDWLDGYYHLRIHGSTKQTPLDRMSHPLHEVKRILPDTVLKAFFWEETRKPDKAACIKIDGNMYEVASELSQKSITVKYDPFDMSTIEVFYMGKQYPNAVLLELRSNRHFKTQTLKEETPKISSSLSFFQAAEKNKLQTMNPVIFRKEGDPI